VPDPHHPHHEPPHCGDIGDSGFPANQECTTTLDDRADLLLETVVEFRKQENGAPRHRYAKLMLIAVEPNDPARPDQLAAVFGIGYEVPKPPDFAGPTVDAIRSRKNCYLLKYNNVQYQIITKAHAE
jgi:hypothetical protein